MSGVSIWCCLVVLTLQRAALPERAGIWCLGTPENPNTGAGQCIGEAGQDRPMGAVRLNWHDLELSLLSSLRAAPDMLCGASMLNISMWTSKGRNPQVLYSPRTKDQ